MSIRFYVHQMQDTIANFLALFKRFPLVALGEAHGLQEEADFVIDLLHHPDFPKTVNTIVVEFGNALYQPLIDRFITGEPIANSDLRPVWRDIIGSPFGGITDAPVYEQFYRTVRAINRTLPAAQQIRVLLGDPPVDWSQVTSEAELSPYWDRVGHYVEVVERKVLQHHRRALLIAGTMHFVRQLRPEGVNEIAQLDQRYPGSTFVIAPHLTPELPSKKFEVFDSQLSSWPIPSLVTVRDTWLNAMDANVLFGNTAVYYDEDESAEVRRSVFHHTGDERINLVSLGDVIDAYLYLGPLRSLTRSWPNPAIYKGDPAWLAEMQRRHTLLIGRPLNETILFAEPAPQYLNWSGDLQPSSQDSQPPEDSDP